MKVSDVCSRKSNQSPIHTFRISASSTEPGANWVMNKSLDVCIECAKNIMPAIEKLIFDMSDRSKP
jgi:hypothetical protein